MSAYTIDSFFDGRIQVKQHQSGYRFSIDSVLLAHHAAPRPSERVLDLGTGCGIIPLIMAYRFPQITIYGVEVQKGLAELAVSNVNDNQLQNSVIILCHDLKLLKPVMLSGPVDLIVSNPPYRKHASGRINPDEQRAIARHEIQVTLRDVVRTACRLLRTGGRFITIYTADRMVDLMNCMTNERIEPKFLRTIHSGQHTEAKLILVEGRKGARSGTNVGPPLIIHQENGDYTEEVKRMFKP